MTMPTHAGLTADLFVLREGRFLTLERGPGRGEGMSYLPGGLVERGEDPLTAAVRETREEAALEVRDVRILRVWTDVVLSEENTAFGWTTATDYIARWCSEELEAAVPAHAGWIRQVRANCELVDAQVHGR